MRRKELTVVVVLVQLFFGSFVYAQNDSLIAHYEKLSQIRSDLTKRIDAIHKSSEDTWINTAWAVMLMKQGIIQAENVHEVAGALLEYWNNPKDKNLSVKQFQPYFTSKYGTRMGNVAIARSTPAMRQQLPVRYQLLKVMCLLHDLQQILLETADKYKTAVMPGYTHVRHAQPTTLGHYLLSVHDPIQRSMESLEHGYKAMNLNELGCGAMAGTSWPIDRNMVSRYLGCEGLIENTNDAMVYSDGYVLVVSSLTNIMAVLSRLGNEFNYWSTLEYGFIDFERATAYSFMMPQKRNNPTFLGHTWYGASEILGDLTEVASMGMKIPHGDTMASSSRMKPGTLDALSIIEARAKPFLYHLPSMKVHEDKMLETARQGYSASSELANEIVRRDGFDYRTARAIVNMFVIESVQRGIPSREADIDILQAAAQEVVGKKLNMSEQRLREALDPVHFVEVTDSQGGVAPKEVARMIAERRTELNKARARHLDRIEKLEKAKELLISDLKNLYRESK